MESSAAEKPEKVKPERKKNGHGGSRAGAGRKPKTLRLLPFRMPWEKTEFGPDLASDSLAPKEMLRAGARVMFRAAFRKSGFIDRVCLKEAMDYARMAGPYYDPHLSWHALGFGRKTPELEEKVLGTGAVVAMPNNGRRLAVVPKQEAQKGAT